MCDPISLAALGAGTAVLDQANANRVARENYRHQRRLGKVQRELADRAAARNLLALRSRQLQERQAAGQQLQQVVGQARRAQALTRAAAAETGTAGASVAAATDEFERQQLQAQANIDRTLLLQDLEFDRQSEAVRDQQRAGQVNALPPPLVQQGYLIPALRGGMQGALAGLQLPPPAGGPTHNLQTVFSGFDFSAAQQQLGGGRIQSILQGLRIPTPT